MNTSDKVGVIVARFQVADLHPGHRGLVEHVLDRHDAVLLALGDHRGERTETDPLKYEERRDMVRAHFPSKKVVIDRIVDHPWSSDRWSVRHLDSLVANHFGDRPAIMYGGRKSFLDVYTGVHTKQQLDIVHAKSGTEIRASIKYSHEMDARSAIIYAQQNRSPIVYSTADIAIYDRATNRVLLGTKPIFDGKFSFLGGFSDPEDASDIDTAKRECAEEVSGIAVGQFTQLGARIKIEDPRYRASRDSVKTAFFLAQHFGGTGPVAGDDISEVRWFRLEEVLSDILVPWHRPLAVRLMESTSKL